MKRILIRLSVITLVLVLLTSCGAADAGLSDAYDYEVQNESMYFDADDGLVVGTTTDTSSAESPAIPDSARKIIENIELSVQTKEFDALIENINAQITHLGGYTESSSISGRSMNTNNTRYAEMVIRIPANNSATFTTYISENSVVTRQAVSTEDVTLTYVDIESRVTALETEKATLERLLAEATSMDDIIAITDKLTTVIADIESYRSQLRVYDNLVDYCTVTLYIDEVEFAVAAAELNTWQQIGANLQANFADMWRGVKSVFVFLVSAIPYILPFAVIGGIVLLIIRGCIKKRKKQATAKADSSASAVKNDAE